MSEKNNVMGHFIPYKPYMKLGDKEYWYCKEIETSEIRILDVNVDDPKEAEG